MNWSRIFTQLPKTRLFSSKIIIPTSLLYLFQKNQFFSNNNQFSLCLTDHLSSLTSHYHLNTIQFQTDIFQMAQTENLEFALILIDSNQLSETDAQILKSEIENFKERFPHFPILVYKVDNPLEKMKIEKSLAQNGLTHINRKSNFTFYSKLPKETLSNKFCGNHYKVKRKIAHYLQSVNPEHPNSSERLAVFYSSQMKDQESIQILQKLYQNYKNIEFVDVAHSNFSNEPNGLKIILVKPKSKNQANWSPNRISSLSDSELQRCRNNQKDKNFKIQSFSYQGQEYDWVGIHQDINLLDDIMHHFSLFNHKKNTPNSQFGVDITINKNKITKRQLINLEKVTSQAKKYCIDQDLDFTFSIKTDTSLKEPLQITATNLEAIKNRVNLSKLEHHPKPTEQATITETLKNWHKSFIHQFHLTADALDTPLFQTFIDNVAQNRLPHLARSGEKKEGNILKKINYKQFLQLRSDKSGKDKIIFIYSNNCPACGALKPILSNYSYMPLLEKSWSNVEFFKMNVDKNSGFVSYPRVLYVRPGLDRTIKMQHTVKPRELPQILADFVNVFGSLDARKLESDLFDLKNDFDFSNVREISAGKFDEMIAKSESAAEE